MRYLSIASFFFFLISEGKSQDKHLEIVEFTQVESLPKSPDCDVDVSVAIESQIICMTNYINTHIAHNFIFPKEARAYGVEAKIYVNFVVDTNAHVIGVEVIKGARDRYKWEGKRRKEIAEILDNNAVEVIKSLKFSEPALDNGKPVNIAFTQPINALLQRK